MPVKRRWGCLFWCAERWPKCLGKKSKCSNIDGPDNTRNASQGTTGGASADALSSAVAAAMPQTQPAAPGETTTVSSPAAEILPHGPSITPSQASKTNTGTGDLTRSDGTASARKSHAAAHTSAQQAEQQGQDPAGAPAEQRIALQRTEPATGTPAPWQVVGELDPRIRVPFEEISLHEVIGKGSFKTVYRASWHNTRVAVVAMRRGGLVAEARLLQRLSTHPNLVQLYRWSADNAGNEYLVMELLNGGSLDTVLRSIGRNLLTQTKMTIVEQVVSACLELSREFLVHGDLAVRNLLVKSLVPPHIKLADFGLARPVFNAHEAAGPGPSSVARAGGLGDNKPSGPATAANASGLPVPPYTSVVPARWAALEVLAGGPPTEAADVWSFGVTVWEIFANAAEPYAPFSNNEILGALRSGYRLERPRGCPRELWSLVLRCWDVDPTARPHFTDIAAMLRTWREEYIRKKATARTQADAEASAKAASSGTHQPHVATSSDIPHHTPMNTSSLEAGAMAAAMTNRGMRMAVPHAGTGIANTGGGGGDTRRARPAGRDSRRAQLPQGSLPSLYTSNGGMVVSGFPHGTNGNVCRSGSSGLGVFAATAPGGPFSTHLSFDIAEPPITPAYTSGSSLGGAASMRVMTTEHLTVGGVPRGMPPGSDMFGRVRQTAPGPSGSCPAAEVTTTEAHGGPSGFRRPGGNAGSVTASTNGGYPPSNLTQSSVMHPGGSMGGKRISADARSSGGFRSSGGVGGFLDVNPHRLRRSVSTLERGAAMGGARDGATMHVQAASASSSLLSRVSAAVGHPMAAMLQQVSLAVGSVSSARTPSTIMGASIFNESVGHGSNANGSHGDVSSEPRGSCNDMGSSGSNGTAITGGPSGGVGSSQPLVTVGLGGMGGGGSVGGLNFHVPHPQAGVGRTSGGRRARSAMPEGFRYYGGHRPPRRFESPYVQISELTVAAPPHVVAAAFGSSRRQSGSQGLVPSAEGPPLVAPPPSPYNTPPDLISPFGPPQSLNMEDLSLRTMLKMPSSSLRGAAASTITSDSAPMGIPHDMAHSSMLPSGVLLVPSHRGSEACMSYPDDSARQSEAQMQAMPRLCLQLGALPELDTLETLGMEVSDAQAKSSVEVQDGAAMTTGCQPMEGPSGVNPQESLTLGQPSGSPRNLFSTHTSFVTDDPAAPAAATATRRGGEAGGHTAASADGVAPTLALMQQQHHHPLQPPPSPLPAPLYAQQQALQQAQQRLSLLLGSTRTRRDSNGSRASAAGSLKHQSNRATKTSLQGSTGGSLLSSNCGVRTLLLRTDPALDVRHPVGASSPTASIQSPRTACSVSSAWSARSMVVAGACASRRGVTAAAASVAARWPSRKSQGGTGDGDRPQGSQAEEQHPHPVVGAEGGAVPSVVAAAAVVASSGSLLESRPLHFPTQQSFFDSHASAGLVEAIASLGFNSSNSGNPLMRHAPGTSATAAGHHTAYPAGAHAVATAAAAALSPPSGIAATRPGNVGPLTAVDMLHTRHMIEVLQELPPSGSDGLDRASPQVQTRANVESAQRALLVACGMEDLDMVPYVPYRVASAACDRDLRRRGVPDGEADLDEEVTAWGVRRVLATAPDCHIAAAAAAAAVFGPAGAGRHPPMGGAGGGSLGAESSGNGPDGALLASTQDDVIVEHQAIFCYLQTRQLHEWWAHEGR